MSTNEALLKRKFWIFDLDGTITMAAHNFNAIRNELGIPEGMPIVKTLQSLPEDESLPLKNKLNDMEEKLARNATPAPGVRSLLERLFRLNYKLGILTLNSRENAFSTLESIGLSKFFKNKGETIRVFPLSNWTELDIWQYIHLEKIPIVPLYFSKERPVVERDGVLILVDDDRLPLQDGEKPMMKSVRFRTLGCYPLSGAIESTADTLPEIIQEMLLTTTSERQGRTIDFDSKSSMEKKKQEGYF